MTARYYTAREVVKMLGLPSLNALYLMRRRGTAPRAVKTGKAASSKLRFSEAAIKAWDDAHTA